MPYVYSTATNSGTYVEYENNSSHDISIPKRFTNGKPMKVTIKGGHGLANKHFVTPQGVVTTVTDEEMEMLLRNKSFLRHVHLGFISCDKKKVAPEKKAVNMNQKDGSAPLTPADYVETENSERGNRIYKVKNNIHPALGD